MKTSRLPKGWDEKKVRRVLAHYEGQSEDDAVAEDEAAYCGDGYSMVELPDELLPKVRRLLARHKTRKAG